MNNGPNTEPWVTPETTELRYEEARLKIIYWFLDVKYDWIELQIIIPLFLNTRSLRSSSEYNTLSNCSSKPSSYIFVKKKTVAGRCDLGRKQETTTKTVRGRGLAEPVLPSSVATQCSIDLFFQRWLLLTAENPGCVTCTFHKRC